MNEFYEMGKKYGTDKVDHHGYHFFYPKHLQFLRNETFRMLEVGYKYGDSARMWEEYFPNADIFSMDIGVEGKFNNHEVIKGDQGRSSDLQNVLNQVGSAKFIIDDGSHHPVHQYETFNFLFRTMLEPGGVYIIEDIECNYWYQEASISGIRVGFFSTVEESKNLIDKINSEFSGKKNDLDISSITYGQNCIIITKKTEEEKNYFNRDYRFSEYLRV